jgi:hypothetical protein
MDINDFFEPEAIEQLENTDLNELKNDIEKAMTDIAPFLAALFHKWPEAENHIVFPLKKEGRRLMNIIVHSPDKELPSIEDLRD